LPPDVSEFAEIIDLALTIHGEARGEDMASKLAVGWVIRNRVGKYAPTYRAVIRSPKQFSCWDSPPNRKEMLERHEREAWTDSLHAAVAVYYADEILNPLPWVYHYHDTSVENPWPHAEAVPYPRAKNFRFYRKVDPGRNIGKL